MNKAIVMMAMACSAHAADNPVLIPSSATVAEFAAICNTSPKTENLNARLSACGSYIVSAAEQMAIARGKPECWLQIQEGKAAPLLLLNTMVKLGGMNDFKGQMASVTLRDVMRSAAPECAAS